MNGKAKSILIAAALAFALIPLAGCGGDDDGGDGDGPLNVYLLLPLAGLGDRAFADSAYEGLVRAEMEMNIVKHVSKATTEEAAQIDFDYWTTKPPSGTELILTIGYYYNAIVENADCDYGGRVLAHLDNLLPECPTLKTVEYDTFGPSFLAGVAAMKISSMKKAATIGGMDIPPVNAFMLGFAAGVEYAGGEMVGSDYVSEDVDGFWSPATAQTMAEEFYTKCDVVFPVAGGSNTGVFEAAKHGEGRYALGVDSDQSYLGRKVIIGSVVKRLDVSVYNIIRETAGGNFRPGQIHSGLDDGGTEFLVNEVFEARVRQVIDEATEAANEAQQAFMEENANE